MLESKLLPMTSSSAPSYCPSYSLWHPQLPAPSYSQLPPHLCYSQAGVKALQLLLQARMHTYTNSFKKTLAGGAGTGQMRGEGLKIPILKIVKIRGGIIMISSEIMRRVFSREVSGYRCHNLPACNGGRGHRWAVPGWWRATVHRTLV